MKARPRVLLLPLACLLAVAGSACVATLRRDATAAHLRRICEACACARCDHTCVAVHAWCRIELAPHCVLSDATRRALGIAAVDCRADVPHTKRVTAPVTVPTLVTRRLSPSVAARASVEGCTAVRREADLELWRCAPGAQVDDAVAVSHLPRTHNAWSAAAQHAAPGLATPAALDGAGQVIGTIDTGVALGACYFRDALTSAPYYDCASSECPPPPSTSVSQPARRKVVQYVRAFDGADADGRGSHTAATAAGAAWCAPRTCTARMATMRGVAHGAQLAVYDAGPDAGGYLVLPDDIRNALAWAQRAGAKVHLNSWGANAGGFYDALAFDVDRACAADPELVVVVAAGNLESPSDPTHYVTSPGLAKNALTVGATYSAAAARAEVYCGAAAYAPNPGACSAIGAQPAGTRTWYSRHGAAGPSGAKPEVVAPGSVVWSARNDSACVPGDDGAAPFGSGAAVVPLQGTSMAAPQVAGAAALVRQYFAAGMYPCGQAPDASRAWSTVPAALVVATLLLSTDTAAVDATTGYGTPSVAALATEPSEVLTGPPLSPSGAAQTWAVCALAARASAVLAWTDAATHFVNAPTTGTLVNDLDLSLLDASSALVARSADRTTPRERVVASDLVVGQWYTVSVTAARIASGSSQTYALVARGLSATGCDAARVCALAPASGASATTALPVVLLADAGADHVVWSLPDFEVGVVHPALDTSGLVAQHVPVAAVAEARCGPLNDTSAAVFALWNASAIASEPPSAVVVTGAVWRGGVVWRRQRLLFCADTPGAAWVDITVYDEEEGGEEAELVFAHEVPVRVRGAPPATNGTYARVDWHEGVWDTVCMPGRTGCGCEQARPVGDVAWFAMRAVALVLAWLLLGLPDTRTAEATVALVLAAQASAALATYGTGMAAAALALLSMVATSKRASTVLALLSAGAATASACAAVGVAYTDSNPYADTAVPTVGLVAVVAATLGSTTGAVALVAVCAAALQRQDAATWPLAPLSLVSLRLLPRGTPGWQVAYLVMCALVTVSTLVPTCQTTAL